MVNQWQLSERLTDVGLAVTIIICFTKLQMRRYLEAGFKVRI